MCNTRTNAVRLVPARVHYLTNGVFLQQQRAPDRAIRYGRADFSTTSSVQIQAVHLPTHPPSPYQIFVKKIHISPKTTGSEFSVAEHTKQHIERVVPASVHNFTKCLLLHQHLPPDWATRHNWTHHAPPSPNTPTIQPTTERRLTHPSE